MTDYQHVWGPVQKKWCQIDYRSKQIEIILSVCAWMGMALFFVFLAFSLLGRSNAAATGMLLSLAFWLICGISAIRIRRGRRKFLRIQA